MALTAYGTNDFKSHGFIEYKIYLALNGIP